MKRAWILTFAVLLCAAAPNKKRRDLERAEQLVEQAIALYKGERYVGAAELLMEAYSISDLPVQLRNAAKAYQLGGEEDRALDAWQTYAARRDLKPAERAEATAEIARIEERRRARQELKKAEDARRAAELEADVLRRAQSATVAVGATDTDTSTATASHEPASLPKLRPDPQTPPIAEVEPEPAAPIAAYAFTGSGAALVITSAVLWFHSGSRLSDLDDQLARTDGGRINGVTHSAATDELDGINDERMAARVAIGAGLALAATGLVWWVLSD